MSSAAPHHSTAQERALEAFAAVRPRLITAAYRMLGSVAEAEDVVQDAWLRWSTVAVDDVADPNAYLATVVTRLCLDRLQSAAARRETYVGPWLPEPVVVAAGYVEEPRDLAATSEELTVALLLALERLSPIERAAFLLHDVFDLPFSEIAATLGKSEAACRQLASRARAHLRAAKPRFPASPESARRLAGLFMQAAMAGDADALRAMLADDAVCLTDGGGKLPAALNPIVGSEKIARFIAGLARKTPSAAQVIEASINGLPGFVIEGYSAHRETVALEITEAGLVHAIYCVRNPDKLGHVQQAPRSGSRA